MTPGGGADRTCDGRYGRTDARESARSGLFPPLRAPWVRPAPLRDDRIGSRAGIALDAGVAGSTRSSACPARSGGSPGLAVLSRFSRLSGLGVSGGSPVPQECAGLCLPMDRVNPAGACGPPPGRTVSAHTAASAFRERGDTDRREAATASACQPPRRVDPPRPAGRLSARRRGPYRRAVAASTRPPDGHRSPLERGAAEPPRRSGRPSRHAPRGRPSGRA
jgi:hypothetical protein